MKILSTLWLLALGLLAGCTSATEKQALYEISEFYGGTVHFTKGRNFSTSGDTPQGHYLAITLHSPSLNRRYDTPRLPASGCAYLAFNNLTEAERKEYDYLKVTLEDSASTHTYTFAQKQLQQVLRAAEDLRTLIFNIQNSDYVAAANNCNLAGLGTARADSLPYVMAQIGKKLNPFTEYRIHGFNIAQALVAGKPQPLATLFVSVPRAPEPDHFLVATIDPELSDQEHFLYGFRIAN